MNTLRKYLPNYYSVDEEDLLHKFSCKSDFRKIEYIKMLYEDPDFDGFYFDKKRTPDKINGVLYKYDLYALYREPITICTGVEETNRRLVKDKNGNNRSCSDYKYTYKRVLHTEYIGRLESLRFVEAKCFDTI